MGVTIRVCSLKRGYAQSMYCIFYRRKIMNEKTFNSLRGIGAAGLVIGIICIVTGVSLGVISIVSGVAALRLKKNILF